MNIYKVTLHVRGCRSCDICRIIEYIITATDEDSAIKSIQKMEFSMPMGYHDWYLNWSAEIVAHPIRIRNDYIR